MSYEDALDAYEHDERAKRVKAATKDLKAEYEMLARINDVFVKGLTEDQYVEKYLDVRIKELQEC